MNANALGRVTRPGRNDKSAICNQMIGSTQHCCPWMKIYPLPHSELLLFSVSLTLTSNSPWDCWDSQFSLSLSLYRLSPCNWGPTTTQPPPFKMKFKGCATCGNYAIWRSYQEFQGVPKVCLGVVGIIRFCDQMGVGEQIKPQIKRLGTTYRKTTRKSRKEKSGKLHWNLKNDNRPFPPLESSSSLL